MSIESGFFNYELSGGLPDRTYSAEDWAKLVSILYSTGVLSGFENRLEVVQSVSPAMNVVVKSGAAIAEGYWCVNTSDNTISVNAAHGTLNRIDAIIVKFDISITRNVTIIYRAGTAASSPVAPALVNTSTIFELCLAQISVPKGTTSITTSKIIDTRSDESLCGYSRTISDVFLSDLYTYVDDSVADLTTYVDDIIATVPTNTDGLPDGATTRRAIKTGNGTKVLMDDGGYDTLNCDLVPASATKQIPLITGDGTKCLMDDGTFAYHGLRLLAILTTSGNFSTATYPSSNGLYAFTLVGGGGGGQDQIVGSGGGAGGILCSGLVVRSGSYAYTIGAGGTKSSSGGVGGNGGNTSMGGLVAGGGYGGSSDGTSGQGGTGDILGANSSGVNGGANALHSTYGYGGNAKGASGGTTVGRQGVIYVYGFK